MRALPDAWKLPEPEWVPLAPGVRWLLRSPDGAVRMAVTSEVGALMARVLEGRAGMEVLGLDDSPAFDSAVSLDRIQGLAGVMSACLYAKHCLLDWDLDHPLTGERLDHEDPEAIRAALLHGAPPSGKPLLAAFLSWIEGPRQPPAREALRLKALAEDHWNGGAERCRACADEGDACANGQATEGEMCPRLKHTPQTPEGRLTWSIATTTSGLWSRGGMGAAILGVDYGAALMAFEAQWPGDDQADVGLAFALFRAIEAGRMTAEAARAEANKVDV